MARAGTARMFVLGALFATAYAGAALAAVSVTFAQPEHFTDASLDGDRSVNPGSPALLQLADEIRRLGQRYLPADARLAVEIEDLDLAGHFEPWRVEGRDTRILRDVYPPRIKLRYVLERPGQPPRTAEETVTDVNYLSRPEIQSRSGDPLAVEKAVLADWFRSRFTR